MLVRFAGVGLRTRAGTFLTLLVTNSSTRRNYMLVPLLDLSDDVLLDQGLLMTTNVQRQPWKFRTVVASIWLLQPLAGCGSEAPKSEDSTSGTTSQHGGTTGVVVGSGGLTGRGGTNYTNANNGGTSLTAGGVSNFGGTRQDFGGRNSGGSSPGGTSNEQGGADAPASGGTNATGGVTNGGTSAIGGVTNASRGGSSAAGMPNGGATALGGNGGSKASAGSFTSGNAGASMTAKGGAGGVGTSLGGAATGGSTAIAGSDSQGGSVPTAGSAGTSPVDIGLPTRSSILAAMQRANGYFVARWPDPTEDIVTDKTRPSNLWTRAIYYEGLMGLYAIEPDSAKKASYYDYAVTWASSPSHPYTMTYTAAGTMTSNADNQACGQTYIDLYRIDPQPERIAVVKANIDAMITNKTVNAWTWIDAIQMSMPVFAKLGKTLSDTKYFDAMWSLYEYSRNQQGGGLLNPAEGLWWRDFHFTPGGGTKQVMSSAINGSMPSSSTDAYIVAPNGSNLYWSRGNGWVMAALVRVLDELPTTGAHRADYASDFQAIAASLLPIQRSDGFWNESLEDPTHCATIGISGEDGPETSGTALFAYGLAWGIRNGYLDPATYGPGLKAAWSGLMTKALQASGLLGYVQNTGDRPCTGPVPLGPSALANFDDYGVGCFLLAGSEIYRLAPD
jgi:unsaturated rhamnogalacturonyl hydrolase